MLLNYGQMFTILPFGNATVVGDMTGAQILEVLNQAPLVSNGVIQPSGLRYKYYGYTDTNPGPQPYAWGAYDACVVNKTTKMCDPLDLKKTYRVGTNEFLAPAGQDGYLGFKYMTNITYWGDMLNAVNDWAAKTYTQANPYKGPNGDGKLDGRITRIGTDAGGDIIPVTILHHNDSHGRLFKGTVVGYTQLATLINQERAHNPTRTLLLNSGDSIQGDAMMAYYKSAPLGYGSDGTALPAELQLHPFMAVMNAMDYTAWTLGNHEFNFGNAIFKGVLKQSEAPVLQANVADDGRYGLAEVPVQPYKVLHLPDGANGDIRVAILGIGNHRIPNYELPSNIVGLTFSDPIASAQTLASQLKGINDVIIGLTHIGFTSDPKSVEVDDKVDTNLAAVTTGIDTIIGGHSHTNPSTGFDPYKYLPTYVSNPENTPVLITQAYRYNTYLGEVVLGLLPKPTGGYQVVTRTGRYISVTSSIAEDPAIKAVIEPYLSFYNAYVQTVIGKTKLPIDALKAYTEETNGANLQADSSVFALTQGRHDAGLPPVRAR